MTAMWQKRFVVEARIQLVALRRCRDMGDTMLQTFR